MTKINYVLGQNNLITSWAAVPFHEERPWVEVEDCESIHLGFDKVVNGEFVADAEGYAAYMAAQAARQAKFDRIAELKGLLADSDYKAIKHSEGLISDEEYMPIRAQRQAWRDEINELEEELTA